MNHTSWRILHILCRILVNLVYGGKIYHEEKEALQRFESIPPGRTFKVQGSSQHPTGRNGPPSTYEYQSLFRPGERQVLL